MAKAELSRSKASNTSPNTASRHRHRQRQENRMTLSKGTAILIRRIAARASSCELGLDMGRRLCVDQGLHERRPIGKDEIGGDGSDVLEKARPRPFGGPGFGPELFEAVANRMECEGEQVHGGEHHGEVLLAVAEVVLKVVAVGLE